MRITANQLRLLINQRVGTSTRRLSAAAATEASLGNEVKKNRSHMSGFSIHSYGEDELQFSKNIRKPQIKNPTEILVKVTSSSVNPIDLAMMGKLN